MIRYLIYLMSEQFHRRWININDPQFLLRVFARPLNRNPKRVELNLIQLGCDFDEKYLMYIIIQPVPGCFRVMSISPSYASCTGGHYHSTPSEFFHLNILIL